VTSTAQAAPKPGKRYPMNLRTTYEVRQKLETAARMSGRSLMAEAEHRVQQSIDQDDVFGGPELRRIAYAMATGFALTGQFSAGPDVPAKEWLRGPAAITATAAAVDAVIHALPFDDDALRLLGEVLVGRIASRRAQLYQERSK
jgi:hypothetical protein